MAPQDEHCLIEMEEDQSDVFVVPFPGARCRFDTTVFSVIY
jgi:hypothetical protein